MVAVVDVAAAVERLDHDIPRLLADHRIPGMAVGLCDTSGILWSRGFGTARAGGHQPVTTQTMFGVQSCSKMYTAVCVLIAVQRGLLDLDRPITAYLPEFTVHSSFEQHPERRMTLRHLLGHTAGLTHEAPVGSNFLVGRASFTAHCQSIADTWLRFPVGHHYEYSNLGIDLAGYAVQRVSGIGFERFAQRHLFDPLGLARTTFDQRAIARDHDRATGHDPVIRHAPVRVPMVAAGGVYTSVEDACRYVAAHLRGQVANLDVAALAELFTVPFAAPDQVQGYGLGMALAEVDGVTLRGHSGSGGGFGFRSDMYWAPTANLGLVVLSNSENHDVPGRFATGFLCDHVGRRPTRTAEPPPTVVPPVDVLRAVSGQYVGRFDVVEFTGKEQGCTLTRGGAAPEPVRFTAEDEFFLESNPSKRLTFRDPDGGGRPRYLLSLLNGWLNGTTWYRNDLPDEAETGGPVDGPWNRTYAIRRNGIRVATMRLRRNKTAAQIQDRQGRTLRLTRCGDGLYRSSTGETLDLTRDPITYANIRLTPVN